MEHLIAGSIFVLCGGCVVWRMFFSRRRFARVTFPCPLCHTHYTLPGAMLTRRRARIRCRMCRGVFEVIDGDEVAPLRLPPTPPASSEVVS